MRKHAASHGLAVFVSTIGAGLLIKMGYDYYPAFAGKFDGLAKSAIKYFELDWTPKDVSSLILATVIAALWGIAFSFVHKD